MGWVHYLIRVKFINQTIGFGLKVFQPNPTHEHPYLKLSIVKLTYTQLLKLGPKLANLYKFNPYTFNFEN